MKSIRQIAENFFNSGRGYVRLEDSKKAILPRRLNKIYNIDPNQMSTTEVEKLFGEVLRGLYY